MKHFPWPLLASLTLSATALAAPPAFDETFEPEPNAKSPEMMMRTPDPAPSPDLPRWRGDRESIAAFSFGVFGAGLMGSMDEYELGIAMGFDEPGPLQGVPLRLDGTGALAGVGFRGTLQSDWGIRGGIGMTALLGGGFDLHHDPLPDGVSVELDDTAVANVELFVGKAFDATYLYPYVDAKLGINVVLAQLDVHTAEFGYMGSVTYVVPSLSIAPRVGAFIPLDGDWFLDVSGQYGLVGLERAAMFVGIGMWDD